MTEKVEQPVKFINPITGLTVDETITETEARTRGYLEFEFQLRHLEDENEYVKHFIINGKSVIVDLARPHLQYKNKPKLNYERVLRDGASTSNAPVVVNPNATPVVCSMDEGCVSCSG